MSPFAASLRREWGGCGPALGLGHGQLAAHAGPGPDVLDFSAGQPYRLPIAVWNEDPSSLSRQLVRMLAATPGLEVRQIVLNRGEAADALQRMDVYGVVHIPPDLARDVKHGAGGAITLLHNAQLATASSLLQRDVRQVVGTLSAGVEMQAAAKRGSPHQALRVQMEPIKTQLVALFNVSTNYEQFLAATLVPALIHILAMTAGAWSVGRELRERTLGEWLSPDGQSASLARVAAALLQAAAAGRAALGQRHGGFAVSGATAWLERGRQHGMDWRGPGGAHRFEPGGRCGAGRHHAVAAHGAVWHGIAVGPGLRIQRRGLSAAGHDSSARGWALAMPYTHYARLQIEQWQMGAPVAQTLPVVSGLLLAALVLLALASAGLLRGLRRPDKWGGR